MDQYKIDRLNDVISRLNQFKESELQPAIKDVLKCSDAQAMKLGKSHCNALSFYGILFAEEITVLSYKEYFSLMYDKTFKDGNGKTRHFIEDDGYVSVLKDKICQVLGANIKTEKFLDWKYVAEPEDADEDCFYQLHIQKSEHYMAAWYDSGIDQFMLSDTNDRGIGVPAIGASRVDRAHFASIIKCQFEV